MFNNIAAAAECGPVTSEHFRPFIGEGNWLVVDQDDVPTAQEFRGVYQDDLVCRFRVDSVSADSRRNMVRITVFFGTWDGGDRGIHMDLDADELAIRICES